MVEFVTILFTSDGVLYGRHYHFLATSERGRGTYSDRI